MKLRAWSMVGLLVFGASVSAQEVVNSPDYHARHNAGSVYYQGPGQQPAQQQPPPQPTGYWEKTWGAIAPSPKGGVLGTALGASSKEEAERLALEDCKAKGGAACQVDLVYHNQCAAMVVGDKRLRLQGAESIEAASALAMSRCTDSDTNCKVYYSACTEPIFHRY